MIKVFQVQNCLIFGNFELASKRKENSYFEPMIFLPYLNMGENGSIQKVCATSMNAAKYSKREIGNMYSRY